MLSISFTTTQRPHQLAQQVARLSALRCQPALPIAFEDSARFKVQSPALSSSKKSSFLCNAAVVNRRPPFSSNSPGFSWCLMPPVPCAISSHATEPCPRLVAPNRLAVPILQLTVDCPLRLRQVLVFLVSLVPPRTKISALHTPVAKCLWL